ncbi:MAG TPA: epoxide hydrolase N-terminal domain-containing protein [Propionibacteriaceae bacterium]|nr:epoxide hydrolase N-terminal domain-containing protein [Propionibacteriaceae bacterium]
MSNEPTPSRGAQVRRFPLEPTPIRVSEEVLADLQRRLGSTRWPEDAGNQDWYYGVHRAYLQELVDYWRSDFDWRRAEAAINADALHGIHIGSGQKLTLFNGDRAWDLSGGRPIPSGLPADLHTQIVALDKRFAVHLAAHTLAPSTLAYGLSDSPAGMLAWILERWVNWSDNGGDIETVFSKTTCAPTP